MASLVSLPSDPTDLFCRELAHSMHRKGKPEVASNTIKTLKESLKAFRSRHDAVSERSVVKLVSLLGKYKSTCSRLENATFAAALELLLSARYSRKKERSLLLLSTSFYNDSHKPEPQKTIEKRKAVVAKECLRILLNAFTDLTENARIRRWVGVLLLQLLQDSEEARTTFESSPEDERRKLGIMVVEEKNEILRITCGQLLRALLSWEIPHKSLWPIDTDPKLYIGFPLSSQTDKHWNNAFQTYIDQLFDNSAPSQATGKIYFAQAVSADPSGPRLSGRSINVLIDTEIFICAQESDDSFSETIEIPFAAISDINIEDTIIEGFMEIRADPVDVVITLKSSKVILCYINALPVAVKEVRITVIDEELAQVIGEELLQLSASQKVSQSIESIPIDQTSYDSLKLDSLSSQQSIVVTSQGSGHAPTPSLILDSAFDLSNHSSNGVVLNPNSTQAIEKQQDVISAKKEVSENVINSLDIIPEKDNATGAPPVVKQSKVMEKIRPNVQIIYSQQESTKIIDHLFGGGAVSLQDDSEDIYNASPPIHISQLDGLTTKGSALIPEPESVRSELSNKASPIENTETLVSEASSPERPSRPTKQVPASKVKNKSTKKGNSGPAPPQKDSKRMNRYSVKPRPRENRIINNKNDLRSASITDKITKETSKKESTRRGAQAADAEKRPRRPLLRNLLESTTSKGIKGNMRHKKSEAENGIKAETVPNVKKELPKTSTSTNRFFAQFGALMDGVADANRSNPAIDEVSDGPSVQPLFDFSDNEPFILSSPPRRRPRLEENVKARDPGQTPVRKFPVQHQVSPIYTRNQGSPHMHSRTRDATAALNSVLVDRAPLVDNYLARKTPLVGFSAKGPRNQGIVNVKALSPLRIIQTEKPLSLLRPFNADKNEEHGKKKRKADDQSGIEIVKKHKTAQAYKTVIPITYKKRDLPPAFQDVYETDNETSRPDPRQNVTFGSQGSRVDENGSPKASGNGIQQRQNYKIKAREILRDVQPVETHDDEAAPFFQYSGDENLQVTVSKDFPPVISSLEGPVSPSYDSKDITTIYVPQRKLSIEQNKEVESGPVLLRKSKASEPFLQQSKEDDGLEVEGSKIMTATNFVRQPQLWKQNRTAKSVTSPLVPVPRKKRISLQEDPEATLIGYENEPSIDEVSSPSDMTDGSLESALEASPYEDGNVLQFGEWRKALRPHQRGVLDVLYQISNDLVRFLISHESAIDDVLMDYLRSCGRIIRQFEDDHLVDQRRIQDEIDKAKKVITKLYKESRQDIRRLLSDMQSRSISDVEKEWMQQQEHMQKLIAEGMTMGCT